MFLICAQCLVQPTQPNPTIEKPRMWINYTVNVDYSFVNYTKAAIFKLLLKLYAITLNTS